MTTREEIATAAMAAVIVSKHCAAFQPVAEYAVRYADALIEELKKTEQQNGTDRTTSGAMGQP